VVGDRHPRLVQVRRRWGRTPPGDAVRLLDERDGQPLRLRRSRRGNEVGSADPSPGPVPEHEHAARRRSGLQVHAGEPSRRLDVDELHHHIFTRWCG
jgi:hypothetical protein